MVSKGGKGWMVKMAKMAGVGGTEQMGEKQQYVVLRMREEMVGGVAMREEAVTVAKGGAAATEAMAA